VEICTVLRDLAELGCFHLALSGGEPLVREDFLDIAEEARKLGFSLTLFTNGLALNDQLIAEIDRLNFEQITVSIHSVNPQIHQKMFGLSYPMLDNVLSSVCLLREMGNPITVHAVMTIDNIQYYDDFRQYFIDKGFPPNRITSEPLHARRDGDTSVLSWLPTSQQLYEHFFKDDQFLQLVRKEGDSFRCVAGISHLSINHRGMVYPCPNLSLPAGNVRESRLTDIWQNSPVFKIIRMLPLAAFEKCVQCEANISCPVCMAEGFSVNNNLFSPPEYHCELGKIYHAIRKQKEKEMCVE
jgi:radical SAM protein with 4Fe4S-binding SPASM domain